MTILYIIFTLASALVELDPINEEEKYDEVAQAQERSVWIACLFLAYTHLDVASESLSKFQIESGFTLQQIKKKLTASILQKCAEEINYKQAEEILATEPGSEGTQYDHLASIDLNGFVPELSEAQTQLISKIESFINQKHEDLFPPPPKNPPVEIYTEEKSPLWLVAVIVCVVLAGVFLIFNKKQVQQVPESKKEARKKKKN